jgi:hypothetical protein
MKKWMHLLMLSCVRATALIEKKQLSGINTLERVQLFAHTKSRAFYSVTFWMGTLKRHSQARIISYHPQNQPLLNRICCLNWEINNFQNLVRIPNSSD